MQNKEPAVPNSVGLKARGYNDSSFHFTVRVSYVSWSLCLLPKRRGSVI